MPVAAANVVATSQPLAAQAGIDVLRAGGNAVDAAIATAITLTVVEPNNNGLGSDAFAIVWDGNRLHGLNGSGRSPQCWTAARFAGRDRMPELGWNAVTVPGAVSTWVALSRRFGRLPFARLFDAARHYAEHGFQVGAKTAYYWQFAAQRYGGFDDFARHFLPHGHSPGPGEVFRRPDMTATLAEIAASDGESFYRGAVAKRIVACADASGGGISIEDLATHEPLWVTPVAAPYRDVVLHEIPPNGQGLAAQIALSILAHHDLAAFEPDSAESIHLQIEAMKIGIRAAFDHFADPDAMRTTPAELLDPGRMALLAAQITDAATQAVPPVLASSHDTVYLASADEGGMMVSMIQSNYQGFGSGVVVPGTGIAMQNRGSGFVLDPKHPNCVGPRKRPFHTIIPGFVTDAQGARLAFGVMGGHMQHQGHVQMVTRIFDRHQNPQAASDAPRWHIYEDGDVGIERGFNEAVADALRARGHRIRAEAREHVFGGAQLIYRLKDGYLGASDHRKEGQATGF